MYNEEFDFTNAEMLRRKAEEKLKEKQRTNGLPQSETDIKRLLHELQVHQIELEMQNEELRRANETTEKALKKYTILYDFAPLGYFTIDSEGSICDLNFTGADMLGERRFSLINSNLKLFISESSRLKFNNFITEVFSSNAKESCEVMLATNNNSLCLVYMEGIVINEEQKCLLSVVDITDFKK
jgi:PAS domain-containing protein